MSDNHSANTVPSSISQVGITTRYTFLDYIRSRRFVILLSIILLISAAFTAVIAYYRPPAYVSSGPLSFYSGFWGSFAATVVILSGIFFGGDAISGEFQNKTGYFTVPNPVRRSSLFIGKWLAAFAASSIILLIFAGITIANETYYFGLSIPWQFTESFFFAWFYLVAVLGFTFFFSSLFKSTAYSFLVTIIIFFFAFPLVQVLVSNLAQLEPWFLLTYGSDIISNVLAPTYPQHKTTTQGLFGPGGSSAPTFTTFNVTIPEGLAIISLYFVIMAILSLILFERKEFN